MRFRILWGLTGILMAAALLASGSAWARAASLTEGMQLLQERKFSEALQSAEAELRRDAKSAPARLLQGKALLGLDRTEEAAQVFGGLFAERAALEASKQGVMWEQAALYLGFAYERLNRLDLALPHWEALQKRLPAGSDAAQLVAEHIGLLRANVLPAAEAQSRGAVRTLAFLEYKALREDLGALGAGLADLMAADFAQLQGVSVLERGRLKEVDSEIALAQSGQVSEGTAPQTGKRLGAGRLVYGSLAGNADALSIRSTILDVNTAEKAAAGPIDGRIEDFFNLQRKAAASLLTVLKVELSESEKALFGIPASPEAQDKIVVAAVEARAGRTAQAAAAIRQAVSIEKAHRQAQQVKLRGGFAGLQAQAPKVLAAAEKSVLQQAAQSGAITVQQASEYSSAAALTASTPSAPQAERVTQTRAIGAPEAGVPNTIRNLDTEVARLQGSAKDTPTRFFSLISQEDLAVIQRRIPNNEAEIGARVLTTSTFNRSRINIGFSPTGFLAGVFQKNDDPLSMKAAFTLGFNAKVNLSGVPGAVTQAYQYSDGTFKDETTTRTVNRAGPGGGYLRVDLLTGVTRWGYSYTGTQEESLNGLTGAFSRVRTLNLSGLGVFKTETVGSYSPGGNEQYHFFNTVTYPDGTQLRQEDIGYTSGTTTYLGRVLQSKSILRYPIGAWALTNYTFASRTDANGHTVFESLDQFFDGRSLNLTHTVLDANHQTIHAVLSDGTRTEATIAYDPATRVVTILARSTNGFTAEITYNTATDILITKLGGAITISFNSPVVHQIDSTQLDHEAWSLWNVSGTTVGTRNNMLYAPTGAAGTSGSRDERKPPNLFDPAFRAAGRNGAQNVQTTVGSFTTNIGVNSGNRPARSDSDAPPPTRRTRGDRLTTTQCGLDRVFVVGQESP